MKNKASTPYADTRLVAYLSKRILELRPKKTQAAIAAESGFISLNYLTMIKTGRSKLPLDRVPALALALDADPAKLFRLALEQLGEGTAQEAIEQIFGGGVVTRNEHAWLECLREASGHSDPSLTTTSARAIRALFNK